MKVTNISQSNSRRAPDEWREILEIKAQKPFAMRQEYSLQRLQNTNLCQWHVRFEISWHPVGDIFMVETEPVEKSTPLSTIDGDYR